jgi:hypothetical protein
MIHITLFNGTKERWGPTPDYSCPSCEGHPLFVRENLGLGQMDLYFCPGCLEFWHLQTVTVRHDHFDRQAALVEALRSDSTDLLLDGIVAEIDALLDTEYYALVERDGPPYLENGLWRARVRTRNGSLEAVWERIAAQEWIRVLED